MLRNILTTALLFLIGFAIGGGALTAAMYQRPIDPASVMFRYDPTDEKGVFRGKSITSHLSYDRPETDVLGSSTARKRIEVNLTKQRIYALENDVVLMDFPVSSGLWGRTPTGTFRIWTKLRYTKMEGGSKALRTYYYLPNVPFTMYFANDEIPASRGFGIHGAYWHNNFGHPMSHGCINMRIEDAGQLYYWADPVLGEKASVRATEDNPGTEIVIYGVAPS